jgi:uncharacterized protein YjbI with pentapeptide repeats
LTFLYRTTLINRKQVVLTMPDGSSESIEARIVGLAGADLRNANLSSTDLSEADLAGADLGGADLRGAYLAGADLEGVNLHGASLQGADLSGASLQWAAHITDEELEQQAKSLKGAIMPDGSKHP